MINESHASPRAIAERIRAIVGRLERSEFPAVAQRLGVSETSLRASVDESAPGPTLDVITAIVRAYGVDPTWLVTGEYDASTHRRALENDGDISRADIARLLSRPIPSASERAGEHAESLERPDPRRDA